MGEVASDDRQALPARRARGGGVARLVPAHARRPASAGARRRPAWPRTWPPRAGRRGPAPRPPPPRGLHSSTFQLNLSALHGIWSARSGCVARVKGVSGGVQGVWGVFWCQTRLKLSCKVDECKALPPASWRAWPRPPPPPAPSCPAPRRGPAAAPRCAPTASGQGLTLVHFSVECKRFLWDRGCIEGLFRGCFAGV